MGNTKFNENTRVQVPAALHLCKLGYTYLDNICAYDTKTNILIDIFLNAVKRLNPGLSGSEASLLYAKIVNIANNDDLGREFYQLLSANSGTKLIDFENPENNDWHVTTEFTCENEDTEDEFRPDITCFVNGLPLVFIEVKKPNNREGILAERERINKRMSKSCFRRFFNITQLMIFSNNQEYDTDSRVPIQGAFYCCTAKEKAFFNVFREEDKRYVSDYPYQYITDEMENKVLKHRNCVVIKNLQEYQTNKAVTTPTNRILTSMLSKERFLFLLRYGFAYVERKIELDDGTQGSQLQKHVMRYQQLFASYAIRNALTRGVKSGIIWHTQGSFIVDRIDLMEQATDEFAARGLVVHNAKSRKELMDDIANREVTDNDEGKPEIMVVNIQKFKEDKTKVMVDDSYSTNLQRIFFVDEAHRGYNPQGSFLANLLEADQSAVKIALTGTPLLKEERESWRVFGDYIHTYYYDKSIADGYTCKLMREPVETVYKEKIENILNQLAGNVEVKKSDIDRNQIMEHESYLNALLDYIISDFRRFRKEQNDETVGAMIVCRTNPQARELYRLWQERFNIASKVSQYQEQQMFMAAEPMLQYGYYKPLTASLILHDEGDKQERKEYIEGFKKLQEIDVLIVNKMLLTGFDAPRLKKLYLGRSLDGHDLLQALTRVNRPYHDFKYGYVVFDATNDRYLRELNRTSDESDNTHTENIANDILVSKGDVEAKIKEIKSVLFNFTIDDVEEFRKQIDEIENKDSLYELRNTLADAKAIINQVRSFGDKETKEKLASLPMGRIPSLITEVTHRIERINLFESTEHKADVSYPKSCGLLSMTFGSVASEYNRSLKQTSIQGKNGTLSSPMSSVSISARKDLYHKVPRMPRQAFNIWTR